MNSSNFVLARGQDVDTLGDKLNYFIDQNLDKQFATIPGYDCSKSAVDYVSVANKTNNPVIADLITGTDILFKDVILAATGRALDQNLPENYQAFINAIHTEKGLNKIISNYFNAIGGPLSVPNTVFKAFPDITTIFF